MKVRLKIEKTEEYQAEYINPRFNEKSREKLIKTIRREQHEFVKIGETSGVPCIYTDKYVLFPLSMYEFVENEQCCLDFFMKTKNN